MPEVLCSNWREEPVASLSQLRTHYHRHTGCVTSAATMMCLLFDGTRSPLQGRKYKPGAVKQASCDPEGHSPSGEPTTDAVLDRREVKVRPKIYI